MKMKGKGTAIGKVILFGEHAVVYGKPGIAVPVKSVKTEVEICDSKKPKIETSIELDIHEEQLLDMLIEKILKHFSIDINSVNLKIDSTVPIGSGMGSSASLSIALIRAAAKYSKQEITDDIVNHLAYETERFFHRNPSGIDNAVISYQKPVFFKDGNSNFFQSKKPMKLIIADSGIKSDTKKLVSYVRKRYENEMGIVAIIMESIGNIVERAKDAFENGEIEKLGKLMNENHEMLRELGVSCNEIDALVDVAIKSDSYGAKIAGAGKGGVMIALVDKYNCDYVKKQLKKAGAKTIFSVNI